MTIFRMRRGASRALLWGAVVLTGLTATAVAAPSASAAVRADDQNAASAIHARIDQYQQAWAASRADQVTSIYDQNSVLVSADGTNYQGRDQIQGFVQGALDGGIATNTLTTTDLVVEYGIADEHGTYALATADGAVVAQGTYHVAWRQGDDGEWYIVQDYIES